MTHRRTVKPLRHRFAYRDYLRASGSTALTTAIVLRSGAAKRVHARRFPREAEIYFSKPKA